MKGRGQKAAVGAASVALATSGLSSCNDNGAVDPLPPPLQCNTVNVGQTLIPSAVVSDSLVTVTIENQTPTGLWTDSLAVINPVGVQIIEVSRPGELTRDALVIRLELVPPTGSNATFTVVGELQGFDQSRCSFSRTYNIAISGGAVTIGLTSGAGLPLVARQRADIVVTSQESRKVFLEARTPYEGEVTVEWSATDGDVATEGHRAVWELPEMPGLYQVELIVDFGDDGFAFDVMTLELT